MKKSTWLKILAIATTSTGILGFVLATIYKRKKFNDIIDYDELTGLVSERKFIQEANRYLKENPKEEYTMISIDIDNFKYINEMYGYQIGTEIIKEFSRFLSVFMGEPLLMTRVFADHFLIMDSTAVVRDKIQRAKGNGQKVNNLLDAILGENYNFSFSIGMYQIKNRKEHLDHIIDCANFARLQGKQRIGITFVNYTAKMWKERKKTNKIVANMDKALAKQEFVLYYQPKVDLLTEEICGAEALIRWSKDGTVMSPAEFIPLFEKNGFIEKVDYYVVEEVCKFIQKNKSVNLPIISINLSGITVTRGDVVARIMKIVEKYDIKPAQLDLEITESAFVGNSSYVIKKINDLRRKWFKISMDDFGAGISSFNRLKSIPIDILKIDREFIVGALENDRGGTIIRNIVNMATELGLESVAEGVETKEQFDFLKRLGCNVGQGYYFSKPLPAEQFLAKIKDENKGS